MEEKICKNCEYKNSPDAKFCFNCGKNLDENQIENNEKTTNVNSKTNVLAILSLIFGILSILFTSIWFPMLAITFSISAKKKIKLFNENGNGLATTGLVLGIIGIIIWAVFLAIRILAITVQ